MKICICLICVTQGPISADYASRFVATFREYPPGVDQFDLLVICNGGPLSLELSLIFAPLTPQFFPRPNDPGWDVSAYQDAARGPCADYDMMVCCGESIYFHRAGWLKRLADAWTKHGPGMYGSLSSNLVRSHLNTTGFCCHPLLLKQYPTKVDSRADRYEFEHGQNALWRRIAARGMPVRLVTWDGEYEPRRWRMPQNILWRGNQTNCLVWCQHTDRYANMDAKTKAHWARNADRPFK